ncbi:hypothetical protein [Paraburkholderia rhizosphaerae]|uniref:Uncharacterized protein n=1 Tax=Paraburkholderia rhizosphaerae TaxID=480658 RepID=A0A4R8LKE4_9BURK|nr:hypothetical protein [Paraburkholderia rhizosphaerae]TDY43874.1 hypothetical protein BX592_11776 [Paraburkholderia rhizosphaerae]
MTELERELDRLRVADAHIARRRNLIERQLRTVHELARDGHDTGSAIRLLQELRRSLEAMVEHRAVIQETIEMLRLAER